MTTIDYKKNIEKINEIIFNDLENILKNLNKRFYLKFYTSVFDENNDYQYSLRIKKTFSKNCEIDQEYLQNIDNIFTELNLADEFTENFKSDTKSFMNDIKEYLDNRAFVKNTSDFLENRIINEALEEAVACEEVSKSKNRSMNKEYQLLYSNLFKINHDSKEYKIVYIIEVKNVDEEIMNMFYDKSKLIYSFFRMVLDNFFYDYYSFANVNKQMINKQTLNEKGKISKIYNENSINFVRRMSRLFFGKIQNILKDGTEEIDTQQIDNTVNSMYYIHNLIEHMEDISTKTYEGASTFGSIIFLNKDFLENDTNKIRYALQFEEEDRIELEDSKRIRKLLEISNREKGLYLIANHHKILGLGKVQWNNLKVFDDVLVRLDFKGLSKYNLVCVYTKERDYGDGNLVIEDDKKIYRCEKKLEIIETTLVTILFKNPKVKEEEYSPKKLKNILKSEFSLEAPDRTDNSKSNKPLDKIEAMVRKAREQKHGTMVVISDKKTAKSELQKLKKQSTLIIPTEIDAEYVKYLTAIDGAIYFDTEGKCHAIGVILDGIADEYIGDASRGARYNSAHKYLKKLENHGEKCVIVIISEDGMVDIIPDSNNEEKIENIVYELVNLISEDNADEDINHREDILNKCDNVDYILYFKIAKAFYDKNEYKKAINYYEKGFNGRGSNFINSRYYDSIGYCYYYLDRDKDEEKINDYKKSIGYFETAIAKSTDANYTKLYYGIKGNCYSELGKLESNKNTENRRKFFTEAINSYNKYVEISKCNNFKITAYSCNQLGSSQFYLAQCEDDIDLKYEYYRNAIESFKEAIKLENSHLYQFNVGLSHKALKMYKNAMQDFIKALMLNLEYENAVTELKNILETNSKLAKEALEFYNEQCKEKPISDTEKIRVLLQQYISVEKNNEENDILEI